MSSQQKITIFHTDQLLMPGYQQKYQDDYRDSQVEERIDTLGISRYYLTAKLPAQNAHQVIADYIQASHATQIGFPIELQQFCDLQHNPTITFEGNHVFIYADITKPELQDKLLQRLEQITQTQYQQ